MRTTKFATMPQRAKPTAMTVMGMKIRGAFFLGENSSPSRGLSKRDILFCLSVARLVSGAVEAGTNRFELIDSKGPKRLEFVRGKVLLV